MPNNRIDHVGKNRTMLERNRKIIYSTQSICALCGKPVEFDKKAPHPMSASVDHIIPINKGGHPTDIENLQLTHLYCNRMKSDKLFVKEKLIGKKENYIDANRRNLPQSVDWASV